MGRHRPLSERFWEKVVASNAEYCWKWTASTNGGGYGIIGVGRRNRGAHIVAYELLVGPIPSDGLVFDHLCRNRACVNPSHLERVSAAENTKRGLAGHINRSKTHCAQGHPLEGENLYSSPSGRRVCKTCSRFWTRRMREDQRRARGALPANGLKTHCKNGHPFDEQNTHYYANGYRTCRTCDRERARNKRALSREETL